MAGDLPKQPEQMPSAPITDDHAPTVAPLHERNSFWGAVGALGTCVSILISLFPGLNRNICWGFAWGFGCLGIWAVASMKFPQRNTLYSVIGGVALGMGFILLGLLLPQKTAVPVASNVFTRARREPRFKPLVESVRVTIGSDTLSYSAESLRTRSVAPYNLNGQTPFLIYMEGDELFVDVTVGGGMGTPTARIKHNQFSEAPVGWDINFDDYAIEFVDKDRRPMLQLIYNLSQTEAEIRGMFSPSDQGSVVVSEGRTTILLGQRPSMNSYPLNKTIFKYPSSDHPGERLTPP